MKCPRCGRDTDVIDTRWFRGDKQHNGHQGIRRRRKCPRGHRFTTYERLAEHDADKELVALKERAMAVVDSFFSGKGKT